MTQPPVLFEKTGLLATLTLNRPEVYNAIDAEMAGSLCRTLDALSEDREVRVLVFRGAGGNFCAGADISLFQEDRPASDWLEGMGLFGKIVRKLRAIPQPVIAGLQGVAIGGGANLALAADFVIAAHTTRIRENFIHIGAILDGGGTFFLPRLVGLVKARELALLGNEIDGKTSADLGLIFRSVPEADLEREVQSLANTLIERPLQAMSLIKRGLDQAFERTLEEVLEWESAHQAIMLSSPEHKMLVQWFLRTRARRQDAPGT